MLGDTHPRDAHLSRLTIGGYGADRAPWLLLAKSVFRDGPESNKKKLSVAIFLAGYQPHVVYCRPSWNSRLSE